jgi:hypothetical protein
MILTNAFSLNMIEVTESETLSVKIIKISLDQAKKICINVDTNAIGHSDTDRLVRGQLNNDLIPSGERLTVQMDSTTVLLVAQYKGPRLPEGATELPEGSRIDYLVVSLG